MTCTCEVHTEHIETGIGMYEEHSIRMCVLHRAAPAMLEALKVTWDALSDILENPGIMTDAEREAGIKACEQASIVFAQAQAEGKE